jgi:hypothetical protein
MATGYKESLGLAQLELVKIQYLAGEFEFEEE